MKDINKHAFRDAQKSISCLELSLCLSEIKIMGYGSVCLYHSGGPDRNCGTDIKLSRC